MEKTVEKGSLQQFAQEVLVQLAGNPLPTPATLLALRGDLGAGKTAFTQALGAVLGIKQPITSPTFTILQSYPLVASPTYPWQVLHHIDAYRLDGASELRQIRFDELLSQEALIVLEWPQQVARGLPEHYWELTIQEIPQEPDKRLMVLEQKGVIS